MHYGIIAIFWGILCQGINDNRSSEMQTILNYWRGFIIDKAPANGIG